MNNIKKIHMMGIGGSGMSGVAYLAEKMGYFVTGCDLEESTAYTKKIFKGHSPEHLKNTDLLVFSPAILYQNLNNPELVEAQKLGIAITWQEFVGKYLAKDKKVICVAGTHGKSTTTAMAGKMMIDAGLDPTVIVGARVPEWGYNARFGRGKYLLIEADEFNDNFLHYHPDIILLTNIEFDHPDYFKNEDDVRKSFDKFIGNLIGEKILITAKDNLRKHFDLKVFGKHNQYNANMVYILGKTLGLKESVVINSIETFNGIERRMQLIANRGGVKVYDDYAHHPTAIRLTLEGVREKFPNSKILVIDEPHGYKRTKALLPEYKGVFDSADKAVIGPIFSARDEVDKSITPQKVADASNHKNIEAFDDCDELIRNLEPKIRNYNYDVVVVMGAGKSYMWAREIADIIPIKFSDITTFRIGGKIRKYIETEDDSKLPEIVDLAKNNNMPTFVIGGGSDILASDKDFDGLVLKYTGKSLDVNGNIITAGAGMEWDRLVEICVRMGFAGLECLSGIPGTVGASPIQNIGAYGSELKDSFYSLRAYDLKTNKFVQFDKNDCKFGYRESIFKTKEHWQRYVITSVSFKLNMSGKCKISYDSLRDVVGEEATLEEVREAVLKIRSQKLENPGEYGNAGSFFKNPIVSKSKKEDLEKRYTDLKAHPFGRDFKISAGWLIDMAGVKEKEIGGAAISKKHSLIIINKSGDAKAESVYKLSETVISEVNKKFGVKLEREVQLINFR